MEVFQIDISIDITRRASFNDFTFNGRIQKSGPFWKTCITARFDSVHVFLVNSSVKPVYLGQPQHQKNWVLENSSCSTSVIVNL